MSDLYPYLLELSPLIGLFLVAGIGVFVMEQFWGTTWQYPTRRQARCEHEGKCD